MISQPEPKADVLARRDTIVAGLRGMLPAEAVIAEPIRLKPYETDGLSAYRQPPLAVVLPDTTEQVAASHAVSATPKAFAWCRAAPARRSRAARCRWRMRWWSG